MTAIAAHLAFTTRAQAPTSRPAVTPTPQHTVVYTNTLLNNNSPQVTTTAVVTILQPLDAPNYPKDGATITGTAISSLTAGERIWATTTQLYWTLSGNVPLGVATTYPPPPLGATTTFKTTITSTTHFASTMYGMWIGSSQNEWYSTWRATFEEAIGTAYPTTVVRTGYTTVTATMMGGPVGAAPTYTETGGYTARRTTTMILVPGRPTPRV